MSSLECGSSRKESELNEFVGGLDKKPSPKKIVEEKGQVVQESLLTPH
jgi:hypothetical protein